MTLPTSSKPTGPTYWYGCYDGGWADLIVPEAFTHPAKFARGLVYRIVRHGLERGYWKAGDTILDPFAGVGLGGLACAAYGLHWVGVELEEKFIVLAQETFALHAREWELAGKPAPVILQGDSRQLAEIVGQAAGVVTSPPWLDTATGGNVASKNRQIVANSYVAEKQRRIDGAYQQYGTSPGQIGAMPETIPSTPTSGGLLLRPQRAVLTCLMLSNQSSPPRILSWTAP